MSTATTEPPYHGCRRGEVSADAPLLERIAELERRLAAAERSAADLSMALDATMAGYWEWNINTGALRVNGRWAAIIGYDLEELGETTIELWKQRCHPDDLVMSNRLLQEHFDGKTGIYEMELRMLHKEGHWIWVLDRGKVFERDSDGHPVRMIGSHQEISDRKAAEKELASSRSFEQMTTTISNSFLNLPAEQVDGMVLETLRLIGEQLGADRAYVFLFSDDMSVMDNTHEWCAEGIAPQIDQLQEMPTDTCVWWMERIYRNEIIYIPRVDQMPEEAAVEKEILEAQDIQSLIEIPLTTSSRPFGYIGFDAVREPRNWQPETASVLKLAGGVIANALQRQKIEKVIQAELDLAIKLSSTSSFRDTLSVILKSALAISKMEAGGIYLIDHESKSLTLAYQEGLSPDFITHSRYYPIDSAQGRIILEGTPRYTTYSKLGIPEDQLIADEKLNAVAILPVSYHGEVIACLNIASRRLSGISELARKGLETITSHIGEAIMHARHEQHIAETKNNLESLFDTIEDLLFIIDMDCRVIATNAAVSKVLGYPSNEASGRSKLEFHPESRREEVGTILEGMIRGEISSCTIPLETAGGELVHVYTKATKGIWDKKPVLFALSRDMSEQVRSQRDLVENRQQLRGLTELLPLPLFEIDAALRLTYANHICSEAFGYSQPDLEKGFDALGFCIPEEHDKFHDYLHTIIEEKGNLPGSNEYTCIRKDGSRFPALFYSMPIVRNGTTVGASGLFVDLTETKLAENALRNSDIQQRIAQEFKSLIDNIPGAVYRISGKGAEMLSMLPDSVPDFSPKEYESDLFETMAMVHPDDRPSVIESNIRLRSAKSSETLTYRIIDKQGGVHWIEDRKTSTFTPEGSYTGIDGILFDVTRRIEAQNDKHRLESQLRKSQRLETIGTLAGGIAHDFNNILTPILGYAEMGAISIAQGTPLHEYFTEIMLAAERAQNLVSQILTFSRAQETKQAAVSVQAIVSEALKLLRPSIPSTITIEQHIDKRCGNVLADPSQIHQVIVNLCTNAFHAMENTGGTLRIDLNETVPDESMLKTFPKLRPTSYISLKVSDTGVGMDDATIERVFEPFFTTKAVDKGTGLGLSVVHGIIVSCNGEITVESHPDKGTTFCVYLPVINEKTAIDRIEVQPITGSGSILFIDDEKAAVQMMTIMLKKLGFSVEAKNSPLEALMLFREDPRRFDLVITDLTMPEMTGLQLAGELRKISPNLPLILMTGYGKNIEYTMPLNRYGISKLLKKPVKLAHLAATVNELLFNNHHQQLPS
ncbi:MAG: PAS domain-containing protein [Chlorobiaceae bacterium]|nr:PAS domain-containing protein [Chlorobiaceae bacterium]